LKEEKIPEIKQNEWVNKTIPHGLTIAQITKSTADYYKLSIDYLRQVRKGRNSHAKERKVAIYLSQYLGDHTLKKIGKYFGLGHVGSVSYITSTIRKQIKEDASLMREINKVSQFVINKAT